MNFPVHKNIKLRAATRKYVLIASALLVGYEAAKADPCRPGGTVDVPISGTVMDPAGMAVVGAKVNLLTFPAQSATTDNKGEFFFPCSGRAEYRLHVDAQGFSPKTVNGHAANKLTVHLEIAELRQVVEVGEDTGVSSDEDHAAGVKVLTQKDIRGMADDPDDFQRQLQALAVSSGGTPGQAIVSVDGFQNNSKLPPKSSITSIRVNPDLFSAEYAKPPYQGGRIEVQTKPGDTLNGAVFYSESPSAFNAKDSLSQNTAAAGKRNYGFELGGPIQRGKSDFFAALEKRDINEYNVVNAVLPSNDLGAGAPFHRNVPAPQRLWNGTVRSDWQPSVTQTLVAAYTLNRNGSGNDGVGGLVLPEAGYNTMLSEQSLRLTHSLVLGPTLLNQARVGVTWKNAEQTPYSTAPSLTVAGAFVSGGSTAGALRNRERDIEVDDDLSWTRKQHTLRFGVTAIGTLESNYDPNTFNGAYLFGGGILYGNQGRQVITGLQQYEGALLSAPGFFPTSYTLTRGTPRVSFSQWQAALYLQDQWKVRPNLSLALGLRYALQTLPGSYGNFAPRLGIAWSPDRKQKWVIRAHAGLFYDPVNTGVVAEAYRLNGYNQAQQQIYAPSFNNPLIPIAATISVRTTRELSAGIGESRSLQWQFAVERQFPKHWHGQASISYVNAQHLLRSRNVNAPEVTAETANPLLAPRPIAPGQNILVFEPSGKLRGSVIFAGVDQHSFKHFGLFLGDLIFNLKTDADTPTLLPQSSYSDRGEMARASWEPKQQLFLIGSVNCPWKVTLNTQLTFSSGLPYNLITGFDNNGDGSFNDRPSRVSQTGPGVYDTPFGLLSTSGVNGSLTRNAGTMPSLLHLDGSLSRTFQLRWRGLAVDQHQALTLNLRVANLLNHTNVQSVGNVVGSPTFAQALTADASRRVEIGFRYTF